MDVCVEVLVISLATSVCDVCLCKNFSFIFRVSASSNQQAQRTLAFPNERLPHPQPSAHTQEQDHLGVRTHTHTHTHIKLLVLSR